MAPTQMQTYGLRQRRAPRTRLARCAEVECPAHVQGWRTVIEVTDPQAGARLAYLRNDSGRTFTESAGADGQMVFTFPAGQQCFAEHWTETAVLYVMRDHRKGHEAGVPWLKHSWPDPWLDQFQTNQDRLAAAQQAHG